MTHDVNCGVFSMVLDRDCIANYRVAYQQNIFVAYNELVHNLPVFT